MIKTIEMCLAIITLVNLITSTWNVYFYFHYKRKAEKLIKFNKMTEGIQPYKNRLKKTELSFLYMKKMEAYDYGITVGVVIAVVTVILSIIIKIIKVFIL